MARYRAVPLAVLVPQAFLAVAWIRSAVGHAFEDDWWTGEQILKFVEECGELGLPFYAFLAELILQPLAPLFAVVVVVAQAGLGALLLGNIQPRATALASIFLSANFVMGGQVNPSVFYIIMALVVLFRSIDDGPSLAGWRTFSWQSLVLLVLVVLLCGPFVRTMHPIEVIDDPAIVLITVAAIFAATTWTVYLRLIWFPQPAMSGTAVLGIDPQLTVAGRQAADSVASELKAIALQVGELAGRLSDGEHVEQAELMEDETQSENKLEALSAQDESGEDEAAEDETLQGGDLADVVLPADEPEVEAQVEEDVSVEEIDSEDELEDNSAVGHEGLEPDDGLVIIDREELHRGEDCWFSVRCHFQLSANTYEERITIWRSVEFEDALESAEAEARRYAADRGGRYLEACDGYRMTEPELMGDSGQPIYSLVRTSTLAPAAYLRQFFFTGAEQSIYA